MKSKKQSEPRALRQNGNGSYDGRYAAGKALRDKFEIAP